MPRWAFRLSLVVALIAVSLPAAGAGAEPITEPHFQRTWERTDQPVAAGRVNRTWMWGPQGHTGTLTEEYADAPGGERLVQYTDKSRMEDNAYRADAPWDVTNGHLAKELMTGRLQLGDDQYEQYEPAEVQVAGDQNTNSPTYAMFGDLMDEPALDEGDNIIHEVLSDGTVTDNEVNYDNPADRLANVRRPYAAHYVEETDHTIASVFWDFMNSSGEVYEGGTYRDAQLFENPFFAIGYPLTEAYWLNVLVAGAGEDVLAQCFERRCLTYNPDNPEGWQVEAGNIGQHYYDWRYNQIGEEGAEVSANMFAGGRDSEVHEVDPNGDQEWAYTEHTDWISALAVDPDGFVYSGSEDGVHKIDPDGNQMWTYTEPAYSVAVDSDGFVYAGGGNEIHKIDPDGNRVWTYTTTVGNVHTAYVRDIAVDADSFIYAVDRLGDVRKIDPSGQLEWVYSGHADGLLTVAVDQNGFVYSAGDGQEVHKLDPGGKRQWVYDKNTDVVDEIAVDAGGFVYSISDAVHKIDPHGNQEWVYPGNYLGRSLAVSSAGFVYAGSTTGNVTRIDSDGEYSWRYSGQTNVVEAIAADPGTSGAFPDEWD